MHHILKDIVLLICVRGRKSGPSIVSSYSKHMVYFVAISTKIASCNLFDHHLTTKLTITKWKVLRTKEEFSSSSSSHGLRNYRKMLNNVSNASLTLISLAIQFSQPDYNHLVMRLKKTKLANYWNHNSSSSFLCLEFISIFKCYSWVIDIT